MCNSIRWVIVYSIVAVGIVVSSIAYNVDDAFPNPIYRIPPSANDSALVELGRTLFYDPLLSADSTTSCGSCHQQFAAFAHVDHALSHGVFGRVGTRNVPSLQNLAWQPSFMWDGAIMHLDMQSISPLTSANEMGTTFPNILSVLRSNEIYFTQFYNAFGDSVITAPRLLTALGRFCATFVSNSSRYDRHRAGAETFNDQETRGLLLVRTYCGTCHAEPLFTDHSFRSNGLPMDSALQDSGRIRVTFAEQDRLRFKVPSLRNIAVTHPYMHDGRFKRLRDVLDFYASPQRRASHSDPLVKSIDTLTSEDRKDIIAFLLTLTDTAFLQREAYTMR